MEYCPGQDLLTHLMDGERIQRQSEDMAREIMYKLLLALNYCHQNNIVHRDIKLENIMYLRPKVGGSMSNDIKVIDFGLSTVHNYKKKGSLNSLVGTPYYVAPEVIEGKYGLECDCWSLGVILYVLITGHLPFYSKNTIEVLQRIKEGYVNFR